MNRFLALLTAAGALAGPMCYAAVQGGFGFDATGIDPAVRPGEDFHRYANGGWLATTAIPADQPSLGMMSRLADLSTMRSHAILKDAAKDSGSKLGRAYRSFMDENTVEGRGLAPFTPWLERIRALSNYAGYAALAAEAERDGIPGLLDAGVKQDDKDPNHHILIVRQAGLGMPDRDYYLLDTPQMEAARSAYVAHIEKMLALAGEKEAASRARAVMKLETMIAEAHWSRADSRDRTKTYNKMTLAKLEASAPGFDFAAWFRALGVSGPDVLLVAQPSAVTRIAALAAQADPDVLGDQLIVRSLDRYAEVLPKAYVDENFAFFGTVLSGTPRIEPRWKRAVSFVNRSMGQELGRHYVARYFPPETKAKIDELVANLRIAFAHRIDRLAWMAPETKAKARAKLAAFVPRIGYPDKWRDFSALRIDADDLFGNALASARFEHDHEFGKLGRPIDRGEWRTTPQTVNAFANATMNEIVFPAAILQPPYFDPHADPAINYGAIGVVIGHEMSHHFDDQGAKYDARGRLADWWTAKDETNFRALTDKLVAQYDAYQPLPGEHVRGRATLGENIADLAGLAVAHDAWIASLKGKAPKVIGGLTGEQRFWLGWAQGWRVKMRDDALRRYILTNAHSPAAQRTWTVRNFDSWYTAFGVKPGDALYLAPADRVRIW